MLESGSRKFLPGSASSGKQFLLTAKLSKLYLLCQFSRENFWIPQLYLRQIQNCFLTVCYSDLELNEEEDFPSGGYSKTSTYVFSHRWRLDCDKKPRVENIHKENSWLGLCFNLLAFYRSDENQTFPEVLVLFWEWRTQLFILCANCSAPMSSARPSAATSLRMQNILS